MNPPHATPTASSRAAGPLRLRGLTWNDPRGTGPWLAVEQAFRDAHPELPLRIDWDVQPLTGFESAPLEALAERYDLLVMDHPHTLAAARGGWLVPIGDLPEQYVGPTRESYRHGGLQWAAPIDAASHLAAWSQERVLAPPRTWNDVWAAAECGLRVAAPLSGVHALMALLTLIASQGADPQLGFSWSQHPAARIAVGVLAQLVRVSRGSCLDWNPLDALTAVASEECDYLPVTFGYAHFALRGAAFGDLPAVDAGQTPRGVLGGAGLAVSASSRVVTTAVQFARYAASAAGQRGHWAAAGGQPAHRDAWEELGPQAAFYGAARLPLERSFIRPSSSDWNQRQSAAGAEIERWLRSAAAPPEDLLHKLDVLWQPERTEEARDVRASSAIGETSFAPLNRSAAAGH